jgi:hypothetical protein
VADLSKVAEGLAFLVKFYASFQTLVELMVEVPISSSFSLD